MNPMMTIEKQVRIPANRHIHMDVDFTLPEAWTPGEVISLLIRPIPQTESTVEETAARQRLMEKLPPLSEDEARAKFRAARQRLRELCKNSKLTSDDFLEQRRKDKELEDRLDALHEEERRQSREQRQGRK
jgi:hypothetical protein